MRVHRNLHNARAGGPQWIETKSGRKVQELTQVALTNVTTRIQPAGQRKCAESGVRSVCAYFDGEPGHAGGSVRDWYRVAYDPRQHRSFMYHSPYIGESLNRWNAADAAELRADGSTWVLNPRWEA